MSLIYSHSYDMDNVNDNFCRSTGDGESSQPWCYTTDRYKRWEYCVIPLCGKQKGLH